MDHPYKSITNKFKNGNIKVKSFKLDDNNKPISLTTTKDVVYYFPIPIELNKMFEIQLMNFITSNKYIKILYQENTNHIHKIENLVFSWYTRLPQYKLMVITWTKGLIFHDNIDVLYKENIYKYFKEHNEFYSLHKKDLEFVVILKDTLSVEIPIKY